MLKQGTKIKYHKAKGSRYKYGIFLRLIDDTHARILSGGMFYVVGLDHLIEVKPKKK